VLENGGFDKCPTCNKAPLIAGKSMQLFSTYVFSYSSGYKYVYCYDIFSDNLLSGSLGNSFENAIKLIPDEGYWECSYKHKSIMSSIERIECCEHLFDIKSRKRYILADKVKYHKSEIITFNIGYKIGDFTDNIVWENHKKYVEYNPQDPYGENALKNKTFEELKLKLERAQNEMTDFIISNPEFQNQRYT